MTSSRDDEYCTQAITTATCDESLELMIRFILGQSVKVELSTGRKFSTAELTHELVVDSRRAARDSIAVLFDPPCIFFFEEGSKLDEGEGVFAPGHLEGSCFRCMAVLVFDAVDVPHCIEKNRGFERVDVAFRFRGRMFLGLGGWGWLLSCGLRRFGFRLFFIETQACKRIVERLGLFGRAGLRWGATAFLFLFLQDLTEGGCQSSGSRRGSSMVKVVPVSLDDSTWMVPS